MEVLGWSLFSNKHIFFISLRDHSFCINQAKTALWEIIKYYNIYNIKIKPLSSHATVHSLDECHKFVVFRRLSYDGDVWFGWEALQ